jgi:hypothetical protein
MPDIKEIIEQALNRNPIQFGESVKDELKRRVAIVLEAKEKTEDDAVEDLEEVRGRRPGLDSITKALAPKKKVPRAEQEKGRKIWQELKRKEDELKDRPDSLTGKYAKELTNLSKKRTATEIKYDLDISGQIKEAITEVVKNRGVGGKSAADSRLSAVDATVKKIK